MTDHKTGRLDDSLAARPALLNRALASLTARIDGEVVRPGSPTFDELASPWNAKHDGLLPHAIVRCSSSADVVETLAVIRLIGIECAVRSGGHSFAAHSLTHGIVVDVGPMNEISVSDGVAVVGAGATLRRVYRGLAAHGLTIPGGSCPSVGIAGFTLGGGLGFLGRKHGLASDRLVGAQVVVADGRVIDCDATRDPDLFWALRGGGAAGLGVVTELRFEPIPVPDVAIFEYHWPARDAVEVIDAWQRWAPDTADEVTASVVLRMPDDHANPGAVEVFGTVVGDRADAEDMLGVLLSRVKAEPISAEVSARAYLDAQEHWAHRAGESIVDESPPVIRGHHEFKSDFIGRPLSRQALDALVTHVARERVPGQARELDFSSWGGAYSQPKVEATAFAHRRARFVLKHDATVAAGASNAARRAARAWAHRSWRLVHDWGTGGVFPNWADADLARADPAYFGANADRVRSVKTHYDPEGIFGRWPSDETAAVRDRERR
jgi:FAD/FMN-containing dehydrogenase